MPHTHRSVQRSLVALFVLAVISFIAATFLLAIAAAAPTPVTVRIEGLNSTILPEAQVATGARTLPTMSGPDCFGATSSGNLQTVTGSTPVSALADGAAIAGVTYDLTDAYVGSFGLGLCAIGNEPSDSQGFWNLKINNVYFLGNIGTDQLSAGDRVLWYRTPMFPAPTLDLVTPSKAEAGSELNVVASAYDDLGQATPAAAATVKLGTEQATTGASGEAVLTAPGAGTYQVSAAKDGTIRSPAYAICTYESGDGDCQLPATATGVGAQGAPAAHIDKPVDGRIYGSLKAVSGTVSGGGQNVSVRIRVKRIAASRCTAWQPSKARFASVPGKRGLRKSSCSEASYFDVPIDSSSRWTYRFSKPLRPGVYALNARAAGPGDSVESAVKDGVNRVRFAIRHRKRGK